MKKPLYKVFNLGRMEVIITDRLPDYDDKGNKHNPFFDYVSWCYPSESIFIWKWEINIQNRRVK